MVKEYSLNLELEDIWDIFDNKWKAPNPKDLKQV